MHLLVTGGAGFIGSRFVRTVLADEMPGLDGARVTVLDKLTYAGHFSNLGPVALDKRLDFVPGDVCDAALVDLAVRSADAIVHFAAETHVERSILAAADFAMTNVMGTQVLLDAALRHGTARFLHVSTDEVYGPIDDCVCDEGAPVAPSSPYAATKAAADLLALAYHRTHGLPVTLTRGADTYGPHQHPEKLIPRFVTNLLTGRTVPLHGDGSQIRSWLHVDDHCRGVALALEGGRAGEIYLIGGTASLTNRELTLRLLELCGAGEDRIVPVADHEGHDLRYALDDTRIRDELGYRPRVGFDEGLPATVQWYRDHPDWWRPLVVD
jgi:dTDP-glucose 4,6-dehydratase